MRAASYHLTLGLIQESYADDGVSLSKQRSA